MRRRVVVSLVLSCVAVLGFSGVSATAAPGRAAAPDCPWVGSTQPVEHRVAAVLARMTLDEKLAMVHGSAGPFDTVGPQYAGLVAAIPRLCIPQLGLSDGPAGVGNEQTGVTQLPAPLAVGASWNRELSAAYGTVLAEEVKGKGADVVLSPGVDLIRDPRAGRTFESFSEDPYLIGELAAAQIRAVQNRGVLAQAKHLAAYNQETLRNTKGNDVRVSERVLQEVYLPPFEAAVRADVASVMCSYNYVGGVHACNNTYLLRQVLKGQFGFDGFVTSDWFATHASHAAANAGLDMQMPGGCHFGPRLRAGLRTGAVTEHRLDDMVGRILGQMFRHGLFDRDRTGSPDAVVTTPEHATFARQAAEEGTVLLRNERDVLPLGDIGSLAVIGKAAKSDAIGSGGGSAHVLAEELVTPWEGVAQRAEAEGVDVRYADGLGAARAARDSDAAVVFVDKYSAESKDNPGISLSIADNKLISSVAAANPNTVVVLNTGGPVTMPWRDEVAGVLAAWFPGQEYGHAIARVLFGDVNPSGKLPVTFPAALKQVPAYSPARFPGGEYSEGLAVGHRWYDQQRLEPLYPFGFGLSYTSFAYRDLRVAGGSGGAVIVTAEVTNTGDRAGAEVAQLYVNYPDGSGQPPRLLKGFQRVDLAPGESARVRFELDPRSLSRWNVRQHRWERAAGEYQLYVGGSSRDLELAAAVRVPRTEPTSVPTPAAPDGAPRGGDDPATRAANVARCSNEVLFAGALGAASLTGLPVQPQES